MTVAPTIHATTVAIGGRAVVLVGPPGSGKSDLALRLIDRGATLVADDRTVVAADGPHVVVAAPPATLAGLIEVRGVGIVALPHVTGVPVALVVDLGTASDRLPEPATREIAGRAVSCLALAAFEASAPLKVERARAALTASGGGLEP